MPVSAILILTFIGISVVSFFLLYVIVPKKSLVVERLEGITPKSLKQDKSEHRSTFWPKLLNRVGTYVPLRPQEQGKYVRSMFAAGLRKEMLPVYMGSKILLMIVFPAIYLIFYGIPLESDRRLMILIVAALAIVGFLLPSYWLSHRTRKRKQQIFCDLPDVLDLMTVCVEAGLSQDAAILRIASDKQFKRSPLAVELKLSTQETLAGKPRSEALRDLGERTMVDDVKSFASMLIQTEKFGTSLARALRVHSDTLRVIRRQLAEEAAAKTAVKLLFPLVFLLMPSMFVVILMPSLLRLSDFFSKI